MTTATRDIAYGVRIDAPGWSVDDDAFSIEPGTTRRLVLRPRSPGALFESCALTALDLQGRVRVA